MHIRKAHKALLLGAAAAALLVAGPGSGPGGWHWLRTAEAIIGAPMTPMSYAGVARRTTARVVTAETVTYSAAVSQQQAAAAQQQAAAAQKQAALAQQQAEAAQKAAAKEQASHAAGGRPPVGAVVASLPGGCAAEAHSGVEYYRCGDVYYRTAFQGNNLVYVVQQP